MRKFSIASYIVEDAFGLSILIMVKQGLSFVVFCQVTNLSPKWNITIISIII